jgi:Fur family peroxide stress response transcriptional regulator
MRIGLQMEARPVASGPNRDPRVRLNEMISALRESGHRITPQRMQILGILSRSKGHPSVEDIHKALIPDLPMLSQATVYKTVALMKDLGQVLELEFGNTHNRYDGNMPDPHPHLICKRCEAILDLESLPLSSLEREVSEKTGYVITGHRLDIIGICPDCQGAADQ